MANLFSRPPKPRTSLIGKRFGKLVGCAEASARILNYPLTSSGGNVKRSPGHSAASKAGTNSCLWVVQLGMGADCSEKCLLALHDSPRPVRFKFDADRESGATDYFIRFVRPLAFEPGDFGQLY